MAHLGARQEFDHDRLEAYRLGIDFLEIVHEIIGCLPRGRSHLADQLERASTSIVLNTAEGSGEFKGREKARFYRMARRSAFECAAILEILTKIEPGLAERCTQGREILLRIASVLTGLSKHYENRNEADETTGSSNAGPNPVRRIRAP